MSEHNERLADIVAQIRAAAYIQNADTPQSVLRLANRIEAAWRRERAEIEADALSVGGVVEAARNKPSGNAAALREAVVLALSLIDLKEDVPCKTVSQKDIDFMQAALALPRRNCDVGTAEEQAERYSNFTGRYTPCSYKGHARCAEDCPVNIKLAQEGHGELLCQLVWAQMPCKEGGAK